MTFFTKLEFLNKLNSETNPKQIGGKGGTTLSYKIHYEAIMIKMAWCWYKGSLRSVGQNRKPRSKLVSL